MYKKTLISLAVASSVALTGCLGGNGTGKNAGVESPITSSKYESSQVSPIFNPSPLSSNFAVPANSDLILTLGATQTQNYDFTGYATGKDPASKAINDLAGFSTDAQTDIKFDGSLDPSSVIANKTVFLLPLKVDPISSTADQAIPPVNPGQIDPTNPIDATASKQPDFRAEVVSLDGGSNNVLRITPLKPLPSKTKFLVVITNGVKSANGQPTTASPSYKLFDDPNANQPDALSAIAHLVQSENKIAQAFLASKSLSTGVTLAYSFTTSDPGSVLKSMASPALDFTRVGQQIPLLSGLDVIRAEFQTYQAAHPDTFTWSAQDAFNMLTAIVTSDKSKITNPADVSLYDTLQPKVLQAIGPYQSSTSLVKTVLNSAVSTALSNKDISLPQPRKFVLLKQISAYDMPPVAAAATADTSGKLKPAAQNTGIAEGVIELPYYLQFPKDPSTSSDPGAPLIYGHWEGNTAFETDLNSAITNQGMGLQNFKFPRDDKGYNTIGTAPSFDVTYSYPFAQRTGYVAVPVIVYYPKDQSSTEHCASNGQLNGVVIFQHGVTADRSVATFPAIQFANQSCLATVAIDQPLHGLEGDVGDIKGLEALTPSVVSANNLTSQFPNATYIGERDFGYTVKSTTDFQAVKPSDTSTIQSGSLFFNLVSPQTARDNLRQGVMDLLNLSASIANGSFDGKINDSVTTSNLSFNTLPVYFVGHSLGGITGTDFAEISNDPTVRGAYAKLGLSKPYFPKLSGIALMNTGGQVTKLLENSHAFAKQILGGLAANHAPQGSSNFENFMYIFQSTVDGADPVNFGEGLGSNLATNNTPFLMSEVVGDLTVPNQANVDTLNNALSAPLAGTEPLMALIDQGLNGGKLSDGIGLHLVDSTYTSPVSSPAAVFYKGAQPCTEAQHITFIIPQESETQATQTNNVCASTGVGYDTTTAYKEMINDVLTDLLYSQVSVIDTNVLGSSITLKNALDQNK